MGIISTLSMKPSDRMTSRQSATQSYMSTEVKNLDTGKFIAKLV